MAATGKKGKKAKWTKVSVSNIIAEPTSGSQNWADTADEETESYGYASQHRAPIVLPSASRAARGGMAVDEDAIPRSPPFVAHISNLPYDVEDCAIAELFEGLKIVNLRIPREGDRPKGFGYVDFENREDLISAMKIIDPIVGGRRIRIDVSTTDNDRRRGGTGGRNDREREYDPERTMGDWRSGPRAVPDASSRPRTMDREREREPRERDSSVDNKPGAWRDGDRPAAEPARTPYGGRDSHGRDDRYGARDRGFGRDTERSGYGGRDGFRAAPERDGGGFGSRDRDRDRDRGFGGRGFGDRDRDPPPREDAKPRERPKLNLLPRSVPREAEAPLTPADGAPLPEERAAPPPAPRPAPVPAEKVFGAAKPVDTAAKEREIEERLRKQEEEARKVIEEKERWTRKPDDSADRRSGPRRDDRGRDSRSYNRDRRDDREDYRGTSRDHDRDRRDYSRDNADRDHDRDRRDQPRNSSREIRDRRDYRDDRDKRDNSRDRDGRDDSRGRREPVRDYRRDRRDYSPEKPQDERRDDNSSVRRLSEERPSEERPRNGNDERSSRSRDRRDSDDRPLPKFKEQEKPNFVGSNKFSFLEDGSESAGED